MILFIEWCETSAKNKPGRNVSIEEEIGCHITLLVRCDKPLIL